MVRRCTYPSIHLLTTSKLSQDHGRLSIVHVSKHSCVWCMVVCGGMCGVRVVHVSCRVSRMCGVCAAECVWGVLRCMMCWCVCWCSGVLCSWSRSCVGCVVAVCWSCGVSCVGRAMCGCVLIVCWLCGVWCVGVCVEMVVRVCCVCVVYVLCVCV